MFDKKVEKRSLAPGSEAAGYNRVGEAWENRGAFARFHPLPRVCVYDFRLPGSQHRFDAGSLLRRDTQPHTTF